MESCENCYHYERKSFLDAENRIIAKDFCEEFDKRLSSLKSCKRFEEIESIWSQLLVLPVGFSVAGLLVFFINLIDDGWVRNTKIMMYAMIVFIVISIVWSLLVVCLSDH